MVFHKYCFTFTNKKSVFKFINKAKSLKTCTQFWQTIVKNLKSVWSMRQLLLFQNVVRPMKFMRFPLDNSRKKYATKSVGISKDNVNEIFVESKCYTFPILYSPILFFAIEEYFHLQYEKISTNKSKFSYYLAELLFDVDWRGLRNQYNVYMSKQFYWFADDFLNFLLLSFSGIIRVPRSEINF